MLLEFRVTAVPVPQPRQRHRALAMGGRIAVQNYTPARHPVQDFKGSVRAEFICASLAAWHPAWRAPTDRPLALTLTFLLPRPKSLRAAGRVVHTKRPDADNLAKAVKDALSKLAWRDDAQVHDLRVRKLYAAKAELPGVEIIIDARL